MYSQVMLWLNTVFCLISTRAADTFILVVVRGSHEGRSVKCESQTVTWQYAVVVCWRKMLLLLLYSKSFQWSEKQALIHSISVLSLLAGFCVRMQSLIPVWVIIRWIETILDVALNDFSLHVILQVDEQRQSENTY